MVGDLLCKREQIMKSTKCVQTRSRSSGHPAHSVALTNPAPAHAEPSPCRLACLGNVLNVLHFAIRVRKNTPEQPNYLIQRKCDQKCGIYNIYEIGYPAHLFHELGGVIKHRGHVLPVDTVGQGEASSNSLQPHGSIASVHAV